MDDLFDSFQHQPPLWGPKSRIGLAVSGGLDSMVMFHLFLRLGKTFSVLHVNYELRGMESERDQTFIQDICARHGITCLIHRANPNLYASHYRTSVQEAARNLRYAWFDQLLESEVDTIATAHHQNDEAETFLLNLTRGTGISGLTGIPRQRSGIIRPLLFAPRAVLEKYAAAQQIVWREDSSNQTDDYLRNRIRHRLIPSLLAFNPSWLATIQSTQARLRVAEDFLRQGIARWKEAWPTQPNGDRIIPFSSLTGFTEPAATLWEGIKELGFSFAVCEQIARAMRNSQPGRHFDSSTHRVWVDREILVLSEKRALAADAVSIAHPEGTVVGPHGQLYIKTGVPVIEPDAALAHLDLDLLHFPLTWRPWQPGDHFRPLGMAGTKKVNDFLINQKVRRSEKNSVTVLASQGNIIWLVGYRIDDRYKVTSTTRIPITFRWTPKNE